MANKIVLVSDDKDFFEYIKSKLELRKSDELFMFCFDEIPEKKHLLETSLLILNAENNEEKTLDLLNLFKGTPIIVTSFNENDIFRRKCYRAGMLDYLPLLAPDAEFRARLIPALSITSLLEKNKQYREYLVKNNIITSENEVFLDYNYILDKELEIINTSVKKAVFVAIAPSDKTKFLLKSSLIESAILNNIRKNDILMNYAPNKYFLLLFDTDIIASQTLLEKINAQLPEKIYAGFCLVSNQKRQQLINEALNRLHQAISNNNQRNITSEIEKNPLSQTALSDYNNFKIFKNEFARKINQIITPVFYHIQQKYIPKLVGVTIEQLTEDCQGIFSIKSNKITHYFKITCPGFSKINIDITCQKDMTIIDSKRITLNPEDFNQELLEGLLEQFITEYKQGEKYDT